MSPGPVPNCIILLHSIQKSSQYPNPFSQCQNHYYTPITPFYIPHTMFEVSRPKISPLTIIKSHSILLKCTLYNRQGHNKSPKAYTPSTLSNLSQTSFSGLEYTSLVSTASSLSALLSPHHISYFSWNADSEATATSSMAPHHHWLHNYKSHHIPIELANGSVIYLEGIGTMLFEPVLESQKA
jgi:hypothetical protein